jgi:FlaA1/EpsC-like NDP-sugar epimerase
VDNLAVFLSFIFAYLLRFNFVFEDFSIVIVINHALITLGIYAIFSLIFKSYSGLLRHSTIIDILNVLIATSFSFITLVLLSLLARLTGMNENLVISLSIIMIHYVLITVTLFFVRLTIKTAFHIVTSSYTKKKKVLIYGAGDLGVIVKRVIQSDVQASYQIGGFLDQNKNLQGKKITGFPVYNTTIFSSEFVRKNKIETLIFANRDISPKEKSEVIYQALDYGLEILETPAIDKWLDGKLQMQQIQKVKLQDLLGRDPIQLNMERIKDGINGNTILVTGATGSIGSEIVRQLTRFAAKKTILIDQAETPMFHLDHELREKFEHLPAQLILGNITDKQKMEQIFQEYRPKVVFHAAAYKHVPILENNAYEAIRVNVGGTQVITELSAKYQVKKFVMISTDKAVNPANVMGTSKRICEMIVQMKAQQEGIQTQFVITRFGNVLGSNGSVIPIFSKQIQEGGPVTVTHPKITRYFMTIPEACQLVLEAGFMGQGGEIFVFDMGEPVKIVDLANQMIRLSGLLPEKDIKIVYTGLRPGEKLYEELLTDKETTKPTHHPKIKIAMVQKMDKKELSTKIDYLLKNLYNMQKEEILGCCSEIVPEFVPASNLAAEKSVIKLNPKNVNKAGIIPTSNIQSDKKNPLQQSS